MIISGTSACLRVSKRQLFSLQVCTLEKFNNFGDCRKCEDDSEYRCDSGECIPAKKVILLPLLTFLDI